MKNTIKVLGLTALVAVIGFAFIACDDGNGNNNNNGDGTKTLTGITAVYTPTTAIFPDTTLDILKEGLTVTAQYSDSTTAPVTTYELGGNLAEGESTVTVTYTEGGVTKTDTFTVTVNAAHNHIWSGWTTSTPATCTTKGVEKRTCSASPTHDEF
jgi:hypothetical protein